MRLGFEQIPFAELGGVTKNTQSAYENGRSACNVEYLLKINDHGVDIAYVLTGRRSDDTLDWEYSQLLEMFGQLSLREREAVMMLLMGLTGRTGTPADPLGIGSNPRLTGAPTLHEAGRSFRGEPADGG